MRFVDSQAEVFGRSRTSPLNQPKDRRSTPTGHRENISSATPCAPPGALMARPWHHAPQLAAAEPVGVDRPSAQISTQRARAAPQPHVRSDDELLTEFKEPAQ